VSDFHFDYAVTDGDNEMQVDVTRVDRADEAVQIWVSSGRLRIPFFLATEKAAELGHALLAAVAGDDPNQVELRTTMTLLQPKGQ
jgi:hypothetical protein